MERDALLKHITCLDFMAVDLHLFLNTHMNDHEALSLYNKIVASSEKSKQLYESKFNPLVSFRSMGQRNWKWADEPWPWAAEYNFSLSGEGR